MPSELRALSPRNGWHDRQRFVGQHLVHPIDQHWQAISDMQERIGGDAVLTCWLERRLPENPTRIDPRVYLVDGGADKIRPAFEECPIGTVHAAVARSDTSMDIYDRCTNFLEHGVRDKARPMNDHEYRVIRP